MRPLTFFCLTSLLLTAVVSNCAISRAESPEPALRVMTFNIRFNNPRDGEDAWPHRKDTVARIIDEHADVVGLQEALLGQIKDLEERLPGFYWIGVGRSDGKESGEYTAIFYRKSRLRTLRSDTFWLSESPSKAGSKSWDSSLPRIVTWADFVDLKTGKIFGFWNTHFDHLGTVARQKSSELIRRQLARLNRNTPVVLTGDFNCREGSDPYKALVQSEPGRPLQDAIHSTKQPHEGPDSTWCGFREIAAGQRIDFVFVTTNVVVDEHRVLDIRTPQDRFASDHLPVQALVHFP